MKTRRIHLQPGECAEIVNSYGTSLLKVTARFKGAQACVVVYEQPDVLTLDPYVAKLDGVSLEPNDIALDLVEQMILAADNPLPGN